MNAAEHVAAAERDLEAAQPSSPDARDVPYLLSSVAHSLLALVATLTPPARDTRPEPHSTAWCAARDAWDTVESGRRFDDLDRELQAALAARWQRTHG